MKAASLHEIKKELQVLPPNDILALCMRLAKYKKENKELLTYLLFEANDEVAYIKNVKEDMDIEFSEMNTSNLYLSKKSLRKILRTTNKFIKYSGSPQTAAELLTYFCRKLKDSGIPVRKSAALTNLYELQIKKINKALSGMHEDLQYDYRKELEGL